MAFLKLLEIIQGGQLCLPTFGHLFMLLPRAPEPKMVVISLLALKWQYFKVEGSIGFFTTLKEEKINASTLKNCHFKASRDITTIFGSGTLGNNINKWPKVGRHNWPPCMISDNFKKAILLYVYYMGYIETWPTLYLWKCNLSQMQFCSSIWLIKNDLKNIFSFLG